MVLVEQIKLKIQQEKSIPFVDYMQMVLYSPQLGYYSSNLPKLGREGDFITAPELSYLFGKTLASQLKPILQSMPHSEILEFGAGSGQLCIDIMQELEAQSALPTYYNILEVSGSFKARQQALIEEKIPHLAHKVRWLQSLPQKPFKGVILANEVLDAMPVHRFLKTEEKLLESHIMLNTEGHFEEGFIPCTNKTLKDYINNHLKNLKTPYLSEVNLHIGPWIKSCSEILEAGGCFIIDYGFPRREYYHPDRDQGTLVCHWQHKVHGDFFAHPGEEDLTAHVDFTHVAEAALDAGFQVSGYTNQAAFLLSNGILSLLEAIEDEREKFRQTQAVKQLLQPSEMGELFKVIALTKAYNDPLQGFFLHDKRASL